MHRRINESKALFEYIKVQIPIKNAVDCQILFDFLDIAKEKRELQVRSFFGRHFKKKIYTEHKEDIIQVVLKGKTKQQITNHLMEFYPSETVSEIYKKLQPLIKELPGK